MQFSAECTVPEAVTGDPSDVAVALEVAGALWEKGDREEAIRWLKRAVEAAGHAGDTARAAGLAQAAGHIEAALGRRDEEAMQPATVSAPQPDSGPPSPAASVRTVPARADERIRVSVKTSVRDPQLLLLRPLPEGQRAPTGTREGFLVLAETEPGERSHANGSHTNGGGSL